MNEITNLIRSYRECSRHVWNCHFRDLPDGWHEFINVDHELLSGIVLVQTDDRKDWLAERMEHGYYPTIRVIPEFGPQGLKALWAREHNRTWNWEEVQITEMKIRFAFIDFFDWRDDGYQDYQYIRCRIERSSEHSQLVGADVLLPALEVTVTYDAETEQASRADG